MKKIIYAALAATLALIAASCDKQALTPGKKEVEGVYILNNGSKDMNNSKITVYDPQTKTAVADMFVAANGKVLGDTAQDILVDGDDIYISVNISRIIFVTDKSLKIKKEIRATLPDGTVLSPRYLAKGGNGRVYVTYYEGYLGEINPDGYKVSTTAVGASPEGCAWADGKVFVSNSGGANYPNYEKTVSVVDPVSFKETSRVEVNINPATMEAYGDNVFVFSLGDYGATPAKVQRLDAKTLKVNDLEYSSPTAIALEGETLFVQLILNDEILKVLHADAIAEGADAEAGDKLRRRFGYGDDLPAVLLPELLENAADERGFPCGGAAGENDAGDAFWHVRSSNPASGRR